MATAADWIRLITALAFLGYGIGCLFTKSMVAEFERFGVPQFRTLIGTTQLLGAVTLLLAPVHAGFVLLGAGGLSIQMMAGVIIRFRIGDSLLQSSQAMAFFLITLFLAVWYAGQL